MKKIFILFILIILITHFKTASFAHLALPDIERPVSNPTGLSFLIVNYKTLEDIKFLFENSSKVLGYFEDMDGGEPFFLMLATTTQQENIVSRNYVVKVMDTNTTLSNYMLLYNHQIDQSEKLAPYAKVTKLSPHYTLINIGDGKEFDPHSIPDAVEFGPVPFLEGISPPPNAVAKVVTPTVSPAVAENNSSIPMVLIGISVLILLIIGIIGGYWIFRRRRKAVVPVAIETEPPQLTPPTPPLDNN